MNEVIYVEELLLNMQKIGFTSYEARIYIALIKHSPATGYEISKVSAVPQAKVYENITRLENRGLVLSLGSDPVKYVPLPWKELLKKAETEFKSTMKSLEEIFPEVQKHDNPDYVWNIKGYYFIMEKAARMIKEAEKSVLITIWDEDAMFIYNEFIDAVSRGVELDVLLYGKDKIHGISRLHFKGQEHVEKKLGSRWITLIIDQKELLTGEVSEEKDGIAVYTVNPAIVYTNMQYLMKEISSS